ncbi:class I SAM-dependent DNA methyltransferase [Acidiphilium acidophilum]|uniref:type I restriction-modification system subunit M n=1 Tax=Acidiphilium acidophilum TaxID=76588 RepID=UPI002E8E6BCE|nr:class I SAM-dependent DNA methyltransferase [Acidiphilium acidophilum]
MNQSALSSLIWSVADLLRGDFKPHDYGKVILPFTVLRRLDCVLAPTKKAVLLEYQARSKDGVAPEPFVERVAEQSFFNISPLDLTTILGDQDHVRENLRSYVVGFSEEVRDIFARFDFTVTIDRLHNANLLYLVTERFTKEVDLHPSTVTSFQMGLIFEELLRKFSEMSNETAGEHFTPREVIRLMVQLLFAEDDDILTKPGVVRSIYDPTAGTGGMLSVADEHLHEINPKARLTMFGQELNSESYAICKADMLIKGQRVGNIVAGNTLSDDGHPGQKFDYMLSNPPFGVEWKKVEKEVRREHLEQGEDGRFGPGLPRISDGSMLFLMHLISKMRDRKDGGSRFGIVLNGSPLFTGGAGSGESEIRRFVFENDLLEAIIALPTDMFFNTGISTYVWIVSNRKSDGRKGKVQLIDGSSFYSKMRKSLGSKRKEMSGDDIALITRLFGAFTEAKLATISHPDGRTETQVIQDGDATPDAPEGGKLKMAPISRIFDNELFGFQTMTVERPLLDAAGQPARFLKGKQKGQVQPDPEKRDTENVPLTEDVETYLSREVLPHAPDAWIDHSKTKIGYEIPFNRLFYVYEPPRPLEEIDADLKAVTDDIMRMIGEMAA